MALSRKKKVANVLNDIRSFNMHNIAAPNVVLATINDSFLDSDSDSVQDDKESSDSDSSSSSDPYEHSGTDVKDAVDKLTGDIDNFDGSDLLKMVEQSVRNDVIVHDHDDDDDSTSVNIDDGTEGDTESDDEEFSLIESNDTDGLIAGMALCNENDELKAVAAFDCKCKGICIKQFDDRWILALRRNMQELTQSEKDLVIMSTLCVHMNNSEETVNNKHGTSRKKDRKHQHTKYVIEGKEVCRNAFKYMHMISQNKLTACISWYKQHCLCLREKKAGGRKFNRRALTFEDMERIKTFMVNFAEQYAIVLPGRVPGFKRTDIKLLPSCETKASIWRKYTKAVIEQGHWAAKLSSFKQVWTKLCPHIVKTKPMTDLCAMSQDNNNKIYRSGRLPDAVKTAKLLKQLEHIRIVDQERNVLREMVKASKDTASRLGIKHLSPNAPSSRDINMHYSFDFAQQVHFPYSPYQPGPIYFLTPRKYGIFGMNCEGLTQQINFLIDEGMASSKGSESVISYIHHFFSHYGLGEKNVDLHCDNCSGQNKNKFMVWYLLWRVMHGLHERITLNFLISGHTKFAPDWCFGLFKQKYRRSEIDTLVDIANAVESSTLTAVNRTQLVGNEQGQVFVETYNWKNFLEPFFKKLDGIKSLHCMRFDSQHPGVVFTKEFSSSEEKAVQLLKKVGIHPSAVITAPVPPPGLDFKRQKYLYDKIRNFCLREESKDIVCARPVVPANDGSSSEEEAPVPPKKNNNVQYSPGKLTVILEDCVSYIICFIWFITYHRLVLKFRNSSKFLIFLEI